MLVENVTVVVLSAPVIWNVFVSPVMEGVLPVMVSSDETETAPDSVTVPLLTVRVRVQVLPFHPAALKVTVRAAEEPVIEDRAGVVKVPVLEALPTFIAPVIG